MPWIDLCTQVGEDLALEMLGRALGIFFLPGYGSEGSIVKEAQQNGPYLIR